MPLQRTDRFLDRQARLYSLCETAQTNQRRKTAKGLVLRGKWLRPLIGGMSHVFENCRPAA